MVNLLLCGNKRVFDGALTLLLSMTNRTAETIRCYLMTMDLTRVSPDFVSITDEQTAFLNRIVQGKNPENRVEKLDVTEMYEREFHECVNETAYCTPYTLLRLLADLYPGLPDKLLYLDMDIMIAGDIKKLWDIDVSGYEYAAVREKYGCWLIRPDYFNAGMLLLNMAMIRETGLLVKARERIRAKKMLFADQSAIFYSTTKKKLLPRIYNEQSRFNKKDTVVCHFCKRLMFRPYPHTENYKQWQVEEIHRYLRCHAFDRDLEEYLELKRNGGVWRETAYAVGQQEPETPPKAPDRLAVLEKIGRLEREGRFDVDAEDDPPTIPLTPDMVDYLQIKPGSRIKAKAAYFVARKFVDGLLKEKKLVIKEVRGMENLNRVKSGAVITCNHFNPFDCFTVEHLFQCSEHMGKKQLFKVIREGNFTNFPGFYGFLFRNCNTLPLSQNKRTMHLFLEAVDTILQRGDFILIYPEQSLWWNYRKPKPLKNGAFKFAAKNNVPVIPFFIAMEDSGRIGEDGFPVQEYTVFINEPIYPQAGLSRRAQADIMRDKNYEINRQTYEDFYGISLTYTTEG